MASPNQNKKYRFADEPVMLNNPSSEHHYQYYIPSISGDLNLHPDLSVQYGYIGWFPSYELAADCLRIYNRRHGENQPWGISVSDIHPSGSYQYAIKIVATSLYLYNDGWAYRPDNYDDKYLASIGITKYFESKKHAETALAWSRERVKGNKKDEHSLKWESKIAPIQFVPGKHSLLVPHKNNSFASQWHVPTDDNTFSLHITEAGSLEIVELKYCTVFYTYQQALFAKLRYERLNKG
jgi:hypothetical protein